MDNNNNDISALAFTETQIILEIISTVNLGHLWHKSYIGSWIIVFAKNCKFVTFCISVQSE